MHLTAYIRHRPGSSRETLQTGNSTRAAGTTGGMTLSGTVGRFDRSLAVRTALWTLGVLVVLAAASILDVGAVVDAVALADGPTVAVVAVLVVAALTLRGLVLWTTLGVVGAPVGVGRALATYFAVSFVNTVVPGGGAGGAPVAGGVVARSARTDYEVGITAALTVTVLSNLMVGAFGVVGVCLLVWTGAAGSFGATAAVGVGLFLVGAAAAVACWRFRTRVVRAATSVAVAAASRLDGRLPWPMPDRGAVEARARTFGAAVGRVTDGSPSQSAALFGLSAAAHLLSVLALLLAFDALGVTASFGVLLAAIPTAVLGAVAPTPGAAGGVEVALGSILLAVTDVPVAAVGAAVLIYRASGYASRLLLGGAALFALVAVR